jgi:DNA-binding transcriptional ArsR family regulator
LARPFSSENVFYALAHPIRREIVEVLRRGDCAAGELLPKGSIAAPTLSQHLRVLRDSGVVAAKRDGTRMIYRLQPAALKPVIAWATGLAKAR